MVGRHGAGQRDKPQLLRWHRQGEKQRVQAPHGRWPVVRLVDAWGHLHQDQLNRGSRHRSHRDRPVRKAGGKVLNNQRTRRRLPRTVGGHRGPCRCRRQPWHVHECRSENFGQLASPQKSHLHLESGSWLRGPGQLSHRGTRGSSR